MRTRSLSTLFGPFLVFCLASCALRGQDNPSPIVDNIQIWQGIDLRGGVISAASLAAAMQLNGSSTVSGDIILNPGAVAGNSSVIINGAVIADPTLIVREIDLQTGSPFEIREDDNTVMFAVLGSATATPGTVTAKNIVGLTTNTYDHGAPTNFLDDVYTNKVNLRGTTDPVTTLRGFNGVITPYDIRLPQVQGGTNTILENDGSGNLSWVTPGATGHPVADTTSIVEGSADATKEIRFEVDGLTTGTIRVLTPQNFDYVLAAENVDNTFSSTQTFQAIAFDGDGTRNIGANGIRAATGYADIWNGEELRVENAGHTARYSMIFTSPGGQNQWEFRDTTGGEMFTLQSTLGVVEFHNNLRPRAGGVINIGTTAIDFNDAFIRQLGQPSGPAYRGDAYLDVTDVNSIVLGGLFSFETHNLHDIGTPTSLGQDIFFADFHAGKPTATSLQGRVIFANTDPTATTTASLVGIVANSGTASEVPAIEVDNLVINATGGTFFIRPIAGDVTCTNLDDGQFNQNTSANELQICEGGSTFLSPYIATSFAPLTVTCTGAQLLCDAQVENGILVGGNCANSC